MSHRGVGTVLWATPVAAWTGYYVTAYLNLTLETAIICAAGPSLALIPQAFRAADRLFPELGSYIRWLRRGWRQLKRRSDPSKRFSSDGLQKERAHFF